MPALLNASFDLTAATFAKTAAGLHEIQTRALGLGPLARRLLVLVDGKRSAKELGTFVAGHDTAELLGQLLDKGCIAAQASVASARPMAEPAKPAAPAASVPVLAPANEAMPLPGLPPAASRSAKEVEMARHFMINTTNTMFGQNMRLTLVEAVFKCRSSEELRQVYPSWASTMAASSIGVKRLPELRQKLFQVL